LPATMSGAAAQSAVGAGRRRLAAAAGIADPPAVVLYREDVWPAGLGVSAALAGAAAAIRRAPAAGSPRRRGPHRSSTTAPNRSSRCHATHSVPEASKSHQSTAKGALISQTPQSGPTVSWVYHPPDPTFGKGPSTDASRCHHPSGPRVPPHRSRDVWPSVAHSPFSNTSPCPATIPQTDRTRRSPSALPR